MLGITEESQERWDHEVTRQAKPEPRGRSLRQVIVLNPSLSDPRVVRSVSMHMLHNLRRDLDTPLLRPESKAGIEEKIRYYQRLLKSLERIHSAETT